jgi:hypothetical protein
LEGAGGGAAGGGKSLFELEAFEKSLEYLSKVWEKDKKKAASSRAAKRAFVEGRQPLPVCPEIDSDHPNAGGGGGGLGGVPRGAPLIFSPQV